MQMAVTGYRLSRNANRWNLCVWRSSRIIHSIRSQSQSNGSTDCNWATSTAGWQANFIETPQACELSPSSSGTLTFIQKQMKLSEQS